MKEATLGDICELRYGKSLPAKNRVEGEYPVFGSNGRVGSHVEALTRAPTIIVGRKGSVGELHYSCDPCWPIDTTYYVDPRTSEADLRWLYHAMKSLRLTELNKAAAVPGLNRNDAYQQKILVPDFEDQCRIAAVLDKAEDIRRKRERAIAMTDELLRAAFLQMFGDPVLNTKQMPTIALGDLIKVSSGNGLTAKNMHPNGRYPVYGGNGVNGFHSEYMFEEPQIVIGRVGVYCGAVHMSEPKAWVTDNALYVREYKRQVNRTYLEWALRFANLNQYAGRAAQPLISGSRIYPVEIVLPNEDRQDAFAAFVVRQKALTASLSGARDEAEALFNSLYQRAFRGEL